MRLTVLVDNNTTRRNLKAEAGLSIYIEDQATKVLFDTGESALFMENADKLGINLGEANYIVLSHGHYDHSWGLKYLLNLYNNTAGEPIAKSVLLTHPGAFNRRVENDVELGCDIKEADLEEFFTIHKSSEPVWISERLVFLGEINRKFTFEGSHAIGQIVENDIAEADFMADDTAIVYKARQGLVIITGCSHSGICNIVEQAKRICDDERVLAIIGGLHLKNKYQEQLRGTLKYLKQAEVQTLYACHCTDQASRIALAELGNLCEVMVGLTLEFS
ncbi:MAG: beta-lactamase domain protein [Firmicutes bacterium]|nr:beta-lactamase domain protein [Bacillota bacterium]